MSWESIHHWCTKWLSPLLTVILILGALFGGIKYIVSSEVATMGANVQRIDDSLKPLPEAINSLKDRATKMETHWEDLKIRDFSQRPTSKESVNAIKQALAQAKDANLKLSTETIQEAGTRYLLAADKNRAAWDAVKAFLDYRSSLNVDALPLALTPSTGTSKYRETVSIIPNPEHPEQHKAFQVSFAGGHESSRNRPAWRA